MPKRASQSRTGDRSADQPSDDLVKPDKRGGTTELAPGERIYNRVQFLSANYFGYEAHAVCEYQDGRMVVVDLTLRQRPGGAPVTAERIRRVPLTRITEQSWVQAPSGMSHSGITAFTLQRSEPDWAQLRAAGPTEETLRWAAQVYRRALSRGGAPTKTVADVFGVSHRTAGLWIEKARRAGYLGESAGPGKASV